MRRALLLLLALAFLAVPRAAFARSITIRDFRSDVTVNVDGTVDVTETMRAYFDGSWNGLLREISLQHKTGQNVKTKLDLQVVSVTDASGASLTYWLEKPDAWTRRVRILVPGASDAERTVVVHYRLLNAVRHFYPGDVGGEHDELYWNVTGNRWQVPIEHVTARFRLPPGLHPTQDTSYSGPAGATGTDAVVRTRGDGLVAEERRTLYPGEGLTVAMAWPAGILPRPSEAEVRARAMFTLWPLALPFLALLLMFRQWWTKGRDPGALPVTVQYQPPDGMTPAELGTLVDNSADMRDVTATLVDLAVRGFVGIEEAVEKHMLGLMKSTDWIFHLRTDSTTGLQTHERRFLNALFQGADDGPAWGVVKEQSIRAAAGGGAGEDPGFADHDSFLTTQPFVRLSSLRNQFYKSLPTIKEAVYQRLIERGYYLRRPDEIKGFYTAVGVVLMIAGGIAGALLDDLGNPMLSPIPVAAGVIVSGIVVLAFGLAMAARTVKGARAREAALGFREFLEKVDSDRYRRMITSPELFERYLPHAMAFGVEARWAKAFEDLYREPPDWYAGTGYYHTHGFSATSFSSSMSSLGSSAASTMSSSPSGSGGGGSSGGSGGGGGGGW